VEVLLGVVTLVTAAVVVQLRPPSEAELLRQLSSDIVRILETASPAEHQAHGHTGVAAGDKIVCEAEAFGHDPVTVRSTSEVQWVYAYYLCASGPRGAQWEQAARISGPVAVSPGDGEVRIAEAGLGYQDRVKALIPARYADRVDGFRDSAVPLRLRQRYESEIARG
jgi:hypothetical protein